jgi:hypothetical protein
MHFGSRKLNPCTNNLYVENDKLYRRKSELASGEDDFKEYIKFGATMLRNLDRRYQNGSLKLKQLIIVRCFQKN